MDGDVATVVVWHRAVYLPFDRIFTHRRLKTHPLYVRGSVANLRHGDDGVLLEGAGKRLKITEEIFFFAHDTTRHHAQGFHV